MLPEAASAPTTADRAGGVDFLSADDFDATGILVGVDPCASAYWWMPELHDACPADETGASQATHRAGARTADTTRSTSSANLA